MNFIKILFLVVFATVYNTYSYLLQNKTDQNFIIKVVNSNTGEIDWIDLETGKNTVHLQPNPQNSTLEFEFWNNQAPYLTQKTALNNGKKIFFDPKASNVIFDKLTIYDLITINSEGGKIFVNYEQNFYRPKSSSSKVEEESSYANIPASSRGSVYQSSPTDISGQQNIYGKTPSTSKLED